MYIQSFYISVSFYLFCVFFLFMGPVIKYFKLTFEKQFLFYEMTLIILLYKFICYVKQKYFINKYFIKYAILWKNYLICKMNRAVKEVRIFMPSQVKPWKHPSLKKQVLVKLDLKIFIDWDCS